MVISRVVGRGGEREGGEPTHTDALMVWGVEEGGGGEGAVRWWMVDGRW